MRRRYLFDAPTNCNAQRHARLLIAARLSYPRTPEDLSPEDQAIFLIENDAAFHMTDAARDAQGEDTDLTF